METTTIEGEYTTATILLPRDEIEDALYDQVEELTNHEAFTNPITMMPDAHYGKGAPIGFTMDLDRDTLRLIPNIVGLDVGCGLTSLKLEEGLDFYEDMDKEALDQDIRSRVPVGVGRTNDGGYHMHDDFPYGYCRSKLDTLQREMNLALPDWFEGYNPEYFDDLCERTGINTNNAINSMGSLGGGNHFIEIGHVAPTTGWRKYITRDWNSGLWITVHSGSRAVGKKVAEYWQEKAHEYNDTAAEKLRERFKGYPDEYFMWDDFSSLDDSELVRWATGGMGQDFLNMEAIRRDYDGEEIEKTRKKIKRGIHDMTGDGDPLDYIEGKDAVGYLIDMIFAQTYAEESRYIMAYEVARAMDATIDKDINSTHNYIDMEDQVIRKGATRLHKGERAIVPMNMREGVYLLEGRGNPQFNNSICHGAGRPYSRREAERRYGDTEVSKMHEDIFSTYVPVDELPEAYKDVETVKPYIEEGAKIVSEIKTLHNIKG